MVQDLNFTAKMLISSADFESSFFYIGAGKDVEPLFRYSHICQNYIYSNLFIPKNEIVEYYELLIDCSPYLELLDFEIIDKDQIGTLFNVNLLDTRNIFKKFDFNEMDYQIYEDTFKNEINSDIWAVSFNVVRKNLDRRIRLIYLNCEGMALYIKLSLEGKIAPKVLCTIQTEVLEKPGSLMDRILNKCSSTPGEWIKGFEDTDDYCLPPYSMTVLRRSGQYNVVGRDFNFQWRTGSYGFSMLSNIRHCKSYIKENSRYEFNRSYALQGVHEIFYGDIKNVVSNLRNHEVLITTQRIINRKYIEEASNIIQWETIIGRRIFGEEKISAIESLAKCIEYVKNLNHELIYITPFWLEDENKLCKSILKEVKNIRFTIIVNRPLDLIDFLN